MTGSEFSVVWRSLPHGGSGLWTLFEELYSSKLIQGFCSEHVWIIWWLNNRSSLELGELTYIYCLKATLDVKHLFAD